MPGQKQQAPLKLSEEDSSHLLHEVSLQCSRAPNCLKFSIALTFIHSLGTLGHLAKKSPRSLYFRPTEQWQKQHKLSWEFLGKRNEGKNKAISFELSLKNSTKRYVLGFGSVLLWGFFSWKFYTGESIPNALDDNKPEKAPLKRFWISLTEHTNPTSLLDGKCSPLLSTKYSPTIVTAAAYTEGVARWPTAIAEVWQLCWLCHFSWRKQIKSCISDETALKLYSVSASSNWKSYKVGWG